MKRIAVVGGGIAGLSAAFTLEKSRRQSSAFEYSLFESSSRLGGVLRTEHVEGCQVEAGPDSFLTEKPWAGDLCRELDLSQQLIGSNDVERKTYILVNNKLVEIPDGLMFMVPTKILPTLLTPLFSIKTKIRMALEWFHPPHKAHEDESVAGMVERHYGPEMVDRLADPLLSGVYGGDATKLSIRAVLPRFAEMEAKHGSLGRAMLAARRKMPSNTTSRPLFTSLKGGMQQMTDSMAAQLNPDCVAVNTEIESLRLQSGVWEVAGSRNSRTFDCLILAVPAHSACALLNQANPGLADELAGIEYTSSITINLAYDGQVRAQLPAGFGFLVPRSESRNLLACTFVHTKFPHRVPPNRALLRCFIAGTRNEGLMNASDESVIAVVRRELAEILALWSEPVFTRVHRWNRAMAQYGVGHLERLDRIEQLRSRTPGLFLAGNSYRGIGVPDCIRSGHEASRAALTSLGIMDQLSAVRQPA